GHEKSAEQESVRESLDRHPGGAVRVEATQALEQGRALGVEGASRLGKQVGQEAVPVQLEKGVAGPPLAQDLVDLLEDAGGATAHDLAAQGTDGFLAVAVAGEAEPSGE